MKRPPSIHTSIDKYQVPWSSLLPTVLGESTFAIRQSARSLSPSEWLGIVSSHDSKNGFAQQQWQDSLHSALQLAHRQGWGILVAGETPYADVVIHACKRLQVPYRILSIMALRENVSLKHNVEDNAVDSDKDSWDRGVLELCVAGAQADTKIPVQDSAIIFLSNRLFVVALRSGGKIAKLLARRLSVQAIPAGTTYLSLASKHKAKGALGQVVEWLDRGAVGWLNTKLSPSIMSLSEQQETLCRCQASEALPFCSSYQPIIPMRLLGSTVTSFLVHCTRARRGPWPDQSLQQFHDELLQQPWDEQPTAFMTLRRILKQQRLIATNFYRRGCKDTVCFASKELSVLLSMRRFQSHLARWDWEPYGIMIHRDWLQSQGAKQVNYIEREAVKKKSQDALTFCQVVSNEEGAIDWRQEQEWRIAGDVRLNSIPFSYAIVFVPTFAEAIALQQISRWPIAVCSNSLVNPRQNSNGTHGRSTL
jgi:hypothetical protein